MASIDKHTSVICKDIYPFVEEALNKRDAKFRDHMAKWFNKNHELVFDIGPYDRIYYTDKDKNDLFDSLGLDENNILKILQNSYYFDMPGLNPQCVKEPYVIVLFCAIRYYLKTNKRRYAELTTIYMCFSGKFYASIHGKFFKKFPPSKYRAVMDYVINNMMSAKFDIKTKGSLFGAIESMSQTWLNTYGEKIQKNCNDEEVKNHVQQIRDRESSFMNNICHLYYEAFENKYYLNYETDNVEEDDFRLTTNDANEAARVTEAAINYITSNYVSIDICNSCQDRNVKALEIKQIIENLLNDSKMLPQIKRIINLLICDFKATHRNEKIASINFLDYTITAKPNTKNKYLLEIKSTIVGWLEQYSEKYKVRSRRRPDTAQSYYRAILMYFAQIIYKVAQKF